MNVEADPPPMDIDHPLMTPPSLRIVRTHEAASGDGISVWDLRVAQPTVERFLDLDSLKTEHEWNMPQGRSRAGGLSPASRRPPRVQCTPIIGPPRDMSTIACLPYSGRRDPLLDTR